MQISLRSSVSVQLCNAQEVKVRLTSRNWQQEVCQRFLQQPYKPHADSTEEEHAEQGGPSTRASQEQPPTASEQAGTGSDEYWKLAAGVRLRMLRELCYAVLNTYIFR